ncbi:TPA: transposase, partial [Escherichia coli]
WTPLCLIRQILTRRFRLYAYYPTDIRKVIYTTNAIESLNSVIRHAIKKRKVFPTDDSVKKVVWLAIQSASRKWTMPLKDWRMAMSRFIIEFGDRLDGHF